MNPKLEKLFVALENDRLKLFQLLTNVDEVTLSRNPNSNKWSIRQIVVHLFVSEKLSLGYMKKKSLGIETFENSGWIESVKLVLLILSQRLPFKYKAPKSVVQHTPADISITEIQNQWDSLRSELKEFLNSVEDKNLKKKIYKHPRAGMLNVVQAITFFREHHIHHLPQIQRLLKA